MVAKIECPECGKGEHPEVLKLLSEKKYRMRGRDWGCTYLLTGSADEEKRREKPAGGWVR